LNSRSRRQLSVPKANQRGILIGAYYNFSWTNRWRLHWVQVLKALHTGYLRFKSHGSEAVYGNTSHRLHITNSLTVPKLLQIRRICDESNWRRWWSLIDKHSNQLLLGAAIAERPSLTVCKHDN
jgi:hypothetical protein